MAGEQSAQEEVVSRSHELVVEAACQQAEKVKVPFILSHGIDVFALSVDTYLNQGVMEQIKKRIRGRLYISNGAPSCVAAVKAASLGRMDRVKLITRKRLKALLDAPGLSQLDVNLECISEAYTVFQGNAAEGETLSRQ